MVYNNALHFMYIIEVILIFLSHTFAPYNSRNIAEFQRPEVSFSKNCLQWMLIQQFTADDFTENLRLATDVRDPLLDGLVFIHAALYAQMLVAFPDKLRELNFLPNDYCNRLGLVDQRIDFRTINDERKTCESWIKTYGYTDENLVENKNSAVGRDSTRDGEISLWAANYGKYLAEHLNEAPISPTAFCNGIRAPDAEQVFMNLNVTTLTCSEWINLFGYHLDEVVNNVDLANNFSSKFFNYTNYWTKIYTVHVVKNTTGCKGCLGKLPKSPEEFCFKIHNDLSIRVKYFI